MENIYTVQPPASDHRLPLIFDSPHSGRLYPDDFLFSCDRADMTRAEDNYVDELFLVAPDYGAALLCAEFPRTYIDVNRAADDIDEALLSTPWPHPIAPKGRSHAGIGLIRRLVRPGVPVYSHPLSADEIKHRLNHYYHPYHNALADLLNQAHYDFGRVWHINCHSMPSASRRTPHHYRASQPDFVLGDRDGTSCDLGFRHAIRAYLEKQGFRVAVNDPYKGVEILRRYGKPSYGYHSLQLEINKRLYWDEKNSEKTKNFSALKEEIKGLVGFCASYVDSEISTALAAD